MNHRTAFAAALIAMATGVAGCSNTSHVDVMRVLSHGNCQTTDTGVRTIDYATLAAYRGAHLLGMTESPDATQNPAHLVAIVPAQYPTAGFTVQLLGEQTLTEKLLTLTVHVDEPPADAVLAQMVTHPCLVVGIADPRVERVRVMNAGAILGEVALPASAQAPSP
jgi:hypothetical protein